MLTDRELLQRYARDASDAAFAELVRRHVALVYGAALRQLCGHTTLAADVTQAVFTALAAQRAQAHRIDHLTGWLHGTTRHTVSHTVRAERRRQEREQQAHTMHALLHDPGPDELAALPPELVDEVLAQLDAPDREAVLRRFFEGQSFATLGATLSVSEDAARMRVTRALEKLRALFARRGIHSTAAALGAALTSQVVAAPPQLAAGILASCAALAAASSAPPLATVTLMSTTKLALSLTGTAAVLALGVAGYQTHRTTTLTAELAQLQADQTRLTAALATSEQKAATLALRVTAPPLAASKRSEDGSAALPAPAPRPATPPPAPTADEDRRLRNEKMARLKPLLEAGQPIKGAVVVLVGGKAVPKPVEFVIGQETHIADVDDGTYIVKPSLKPDGSVQYEIALYRKDPATGTESIISVPRVTQTPWGPFTVSTGGGRVFAFDPDKLDL